MERIFGFAEGAVGAVERVLLVASPSNGPSQRPRAFIQRSARRFDVLEVIEPTGELSWVISNSYDRATCNSLAFAERVKVSLG